MIITPRMMVWSNSITFDLPCRNDQIFCCIPAVKRPINRLVINILASAIRKESRKFSWPGCAPLRVQVLRVLKIFSQNISIKLCPGIRPMSLMITEKIMIRASEIIARNPIRGSVPLGH